MPGCRRGRSARCRRPRMRLRTQAGCPGAARLRREDALEVGACPEVCVARRRPAGGRMYMGSEGIAGQLGAPLIIALLVVFYGGTLFISFAIGKKRENADGYMTAGSKLWLGIS